MVPVRSSLVLMASLVRDGQISPVELVEAHLEQIERLDPRLRMMVRVYADEARRAARETEARLARGEAIGLLPGLPLTVKDSFDVAGSPTWCGSRTRRDHRASRDATAVARLRAAGAIILGKTNTAEFLYHYETENWITGRTVNPWDPERTAGGSSGGEAAAIAALCSGGGIGSDGGGSIRVPAHCCGIAGLKPTPGRIPATGHFPEIGHPGGLLGVAGPMARHARDLTLLFAALCGHDDQDPFSAPVPLRTPETAGFRIGMAEQFPGVPVHPEIRAAVRIAAGHLETAGFPVEPFDLRPVERAPRLWWFFFGRLFAQVLGPVVDEHAEQVHPLGRELVDQGRAEPPPTAVEILEALAARDKLRAGLLRRMRDTRVLLLPACGVAAWRPGERRWETPDGPLAFLDAMAPSAAFNLLGLPALTLPAGQNSDGLPLGIQLVGRPYEEELILEVGERFEEVRGAYPAPPLAWA